MNTKKIIEQRFESVKDRAQLIASANTPRANEFAFAKFEEAFEELKETMLYIAECEDELATLYRIDELAKIYHER